MSTNKVTYLIYDFYSSGYDYYSTAFYGLWTVPIWLDDVACYESELTLLQCSHRGIGSHDCAHYEDVSVSCSGSKRGSLFKLKIFSNLS